MGHVAPRWIEELQKGVVKAGFEEAVQNGDNGWLTRYIKRWLDTLEKGRNWNLRRIFFE